MGAQTRYAMASDDATKVLQGYYDELKGCLEDLANKKRTLSAEMEQEKAKRRESEDGLKELTERLSRINDSLGRKVSARNEYDTTIQETEAAYLKILESSQTLDHVMKRQGK